MYFYQNSLILVLFSSQVFINVERNSMNYYKFKRKLEEKQITFSRLGTFPANFDDLEIFSSVNGLNQKAEIW